MSLADKDKETARKKGLIAGAVTAGAATIAVAASPIVGAILLVPAGLLIKDWFMYRAKRGMRF